MAAELCPICHELVPSEQQAFLDDCYHVFCIDVLPSPFSVPVAVLPPVQHAAPLRPAAGLQCIKQWTETQRRRRQWPGEGPPLHCPLCKAPYASVLYDCSAHTFRRLVLDERAPPPESNFALSPQQRKRRARYYFEPGGSQQAARPPFRPGAAWSQLVRRPEARAWLQRELQALLLEAEVTLVLEVALAAALAPSEGAEAWRQRLQRATQPFLADRAAQFAREAHAFLASGLGVAGHDRVACPPAEAAAQQPLRPLLFADEEGEQPDAWHSDGSASEAERG